MTRISIYPHRAFHPGREAVAVDASVTPGEIFNHDSVLGKALYETTETLEIATYPYDGAVVLEGCTEDIDKRRRALVRRLASEIAARALQPPYWESSSKPSHDELTDMVKAFGAPLRNQRRGNSFYDRMVRSLGRFADYTSHDNVIHACDTPYVPPLDRRISEIERRVRHDASAEKYLELLEGIDKLSEIDGLTREQETEIAIEFYLHERHRDPLFFLLAIYKKLNLADYSQLRKELNS